MAQTRRALTISVELIEDEDHTEAEALVDLDGERLGGWGRARRNPEDPQVPLVGEELATARALSDLSHRLLERAARAIEDWEGGPVHLPD